MNTKLGKGLAAGCAMAALLLAGCGDRGGEGAAERSVRNETASPQAQGSSEDAAARAAAQRMGSSGVAQGGGT